MLWWLLPLLLLTGILLLPAGIVAGYNQQQWNVFLKLGPIKFRLYPKLKENNKKKVTRAEEPRSKKKTLDWELRDYFPHLQTIFAFLSDARKAVKINDLQIHIVLGGGDPCDLGVHYGYTCAAISNLLPYIHKFLHVKKQKIDVHCDYLADASTVMGSLDVSLPIAVFLKLVIQHGLRILKQFYSMKNQRKGGIAHEPESSSNA